jgi:oligopeptide transport system substrate-binding protein
MTDALTFRLLGGLTISRAGRPVSGFHSRKERALLCYLAVTGRRHQRPFLAGLFWGVLPESRALANLRRALSHLRDVAGDHLLITRRTAAFDGESDYWLDVEAFEALVRQSQGPAPLSDAVELYRGDFLAGFHVRGCPVFEEWVLGEQERLRSLAVEALRTLVRLHRARGEYAAAVAYAQQLLTLDPWREEAHRELMRLLALSGQRSAALAQYETCRRVLETELGLEPLEETTALYRRLVDWGTDELVDGNTNLPAYQSTELPFTGRGEAHTRLVNWWQSSRRGEGRLVLVEGEAGVGKTRLVEEVVRYAEAEGATVLRGRCYEFGGAVPYQPIAEALRGYLRDKETGRHGDKGTRGQGDGETRRQGSVLSPSPPPTLSPSLSPVWLSELSRLLPELRQLHPELPEPAQAPGEAARQRLFEAVARFLKEGVGHRSRPSSPASCLLFLDDLHWADQSTLDLLHYLVRQLSDAPVWMVGTYRPEELDLSHRLTRLRQGLRRDRLVNWLDLRPLHAEVVEEIARSLVGEDEGTSFGDFLYRESEGNPFILSEVVSDLQEEGVLHRTDDAEGLWRWTGPPMVDILPVGVQDVIMQRVGRLSQTAQRLLSLAAVVGRQFDAPLLQIAAGRDADAVAEAIDGWLTRRLVQPRPFSILHSPTSVTQYDFSHDKIRAVIYDATEEMRRRSFHQQVAETLERRPDEEISDQAGLLAHHWEEAGLPGKAVAYHLRAGDQARLVYAHQEAVDHYERALVTLKERGAYRRAARTLMKLGLTYHHAFDFRQAHQAYDQAFSLWQRERETHKASPPPPALHAFRARWLEPTTLDPTMSPDSHTDLLMTNLFSGLVALSPELDVVPDVARAWEISEGGRRFVFHLRQGVEWSDGRAVTAGDFEYAWKRALDPDSGSPSADFLHDLKGARVFHRGEGRRDEVGVRATDELTLVVALEGPVGYFPQLLTNAAYFPVPRHVVEARGNGWTEDGVFVSNGPFRLEAWKRGELLLLSRNPTYHGRFRGNVERVKLFPLTDWAGRLEMYEADGLGVLGIAFFPMAERERARQWHAGEYVSGPGLKTYYVAFDVSRPPFDDVRVRRAFAMATDRETLADVVLRGYVSPATGGFLPPGMPGHSPEIGLPYNPERARRLLAEAGYPGGRGFPPVSTLAFGAAQSRAEHLASQWREVLGVETHWQILPWAEYLDKLARNPPQIVNLMWAADYPDPDNFLRVCRARTWGDWQNATYDRLVERARQVMDQEERMRLYRQADRLLMEEVPILPLTYERRHLLVKPWVSRYPTSAIQSAFWKDAVIEPH